MNLYLKWTARSKPFHSFTRNYSSLFSVIYDYVFCCFVLPFSSSLPQQVSWLIVFLVDYLNIIQNTNASHAVLIPSPPYWKFSISLYDLFLPLSLSHTYETQMLTFVVFEVKIARSEAKAHIYFGKWQKPGRKTQLRRRAGGGGAEVTECRRMWDKRPVCVCIFLSVRF